MTTQSYYDKTKDELQRMATGDPSAQFLDFGGVNKHLSPQLILLLMQFRTMGDILGLSFTKGWADRLEVYMLTKHGRARADTLEALKLIYSSKGKESPLASITQSATGQPK
jgi:hypothetical protein